MNRALGWGFAIASICGVFLVAASPARAASLVMVPRATWGATGVPSYMQMYIYVPDRVATKPPIYVSCHSCGSTATGQISNIPIAKAAADAQGFILILPDNPGNNCWAVGTTAGLTHDGGGDTHAVAQMIQYVIRQYSADPARVYIMGGSGGAMLVQAMLATYPNLIRAGSARAGVPAGCWADGYASSNQWSNNCAGGNVNKTAQQWGDLVRNMYPGYTGHRPRIQLFHGDNDSTINYRNMTEAIEEWTNVLGVPMTPTSMDTGYRAAAATFNRQFWKNSCGQTVIEAWTAPGATHSMTYEEAEMLKFFGLNAAGVADPEMDCGGAGGAGGSGGAGGGAGGAGGRGGAAGGAGGRGGGAGGGGTQGSGGTGGGAGSGPGGGAGGSGPGGSAGPGGRGGDTGTGGTQSTGGSSGTGGVNASGAAGTSGGGAGTTGAAGSSSSAGTSGTGTGGTSSAGTAGTTGSGGSSGGSGNDDAGGWCAVGGAPSPFATLFGAALALLVIVRRRRRRRSIKD
jgi:poly(hydroxyalkanoate) depolymerase family esterase